MISNPCIHLSSAIEINGVKETVKCRCPWFDGHIERSYQAHFCNAAEHRRASGKLGRCLPTPQEDFDDDHQLEKSLYHLCAVNCAVKNKEPYNG